MSGDDFAEIGQAILLGLQQLPAKTEQALIAADGPHSIDERQASILVPRLAKRCCKKGQSGHQNEVKMSHKRNNTKPQSEKFHIDK